MQKQKLTWSVTARKVIDLTKNGYNPRKLSESERRDLENSIKEFGAVVPIVLNIGSRTNIIIGGEQRLKIYADLGIAEVECMIPSRELTLEEEKELNLRLNKNTGSWSEELLKEFNMDMLLDVGFGDEELQNLFDDVDMT
jgi:ParB-like chromosome segregation protein Spo0J